MIKQISLTDFSDVSKNALKYAAGLQKLFSSDLVIAHFFQTVRATGHFKSMRDILKKDAEREMELLLISLKEILPEKKWIQTKVAEGDVTEMLQGMLKAEPSLIVMGSNGASKVKQVFGSTSKSVINHVLAPTLIIPPECQFNHPKNLVVANDGEMTRENLEFVALFANSFDSHVYFVHVGQLDLSKDLIDRYTQSVGDCKFSFHNVPGNDILLGIDEFIDQIQGDMVVMAKKKRNFLQKIFTTSYTNRELFHAKKPLLILHRLRKAGG